MKYIYFIVNIYFSVFLVFFQHLFRHKTGSSQIAVPFPSNDIQNLGDLERLKLVIETMPDQKLLHTLSVLRGNGRNDHPIQAMWNSLLAGIVFEHPSIESLRRELSRNAQLREMCGFNPILGVDSVPQGDFMKIS